MILPHHGQGRPLIFGEVLFDTFPDGACVLGGAPFNVAWHLQGFGVNPLFISAIGRDSRGEEVLRLMNDWNMDTRGVQIDEHHPTGVVVVSLIDGQPAYDIVPDQAYDFIAAAAALAAVHQVDIGLLYHGSLAVRSEISREALHQLCASISPSRCVDINLRAPWWDRESALAAIEGAFCVKLNDDEFMELAGQQVSAADELETAARTFYLQHGMQILIITRGAQGALVLTPDEVLQGAPVPVANIADTVGAGDAFSSVILLGLLRGWAWSDILARALEFAARICTVRGATTRDHGIYTSLLERWEGHPDG